VPFGEDIDSYFDREVVPHWPDAWINRDIKDSKDELVGVVGTEINFTREFYTYTPPRSRDTIRAEIEAMEKRFMDMLHGVAG
jgi:type I restriction enzyme M protein